VAVIHWNECAWETLQPLNLMDDLAVVSLYALPAFSPELRAQSVQLGFDVSSPDENPFSHPSTGAFHDFKIGVSVPSLPCSDSVMGGDDRCPMHGVTSYQDMGVLQPKILSTELRHLQGL